MRLWPRDGFASLLITNWRVGIVHGPANNSGHLVHTSTSAALPAELTRQ